MTTKEAIDHLTEQLVADEGYRISWRANIAMAFQDACSRAGYKFPDLHRLSNEAAEQFLFALTGGKTK